jgi:hypothetical protein
MPKASDLTPEQRFVGLFVGQKHSGKTVAECSFPGTKYVMDFDGRIRGLLGAPWIDKDLVHYEAFPPRESDLITRINKKLEELMITCNYDNVILDSLTWETAALRFQALGLTHVPGKKGKFLGPISMPGPEDYGLEAQGTYGIISSLKSIPKANIIVSAHLVDLYGKINSSDPYSANIVIGEKLSITDKLGVNVQTAFDHIFKFSKATINNEEHYYVEFRGGIASTSFAELPIGKVDITGKNFYEVMMSYMVKK